MLQLWNFVQRNDKLDSIILAVKHCSCTNGSYLCNMHNIICFLIGGHKYECHVVDCIWETNLNHILTLNQQKKQ